MRSVNESGTWSGAGAAPRNRRPDIQNDANLQMAKDALQHWLDTVHESTEQDLSQSLCQRLLQSPALHRLNGSIAKHSLTVFLCVLLLSCASTLIRQ